MSGKTETPSHGDAVLRFVKKHGRLPSKDQRTRATRQLAREIADEDRAIYIVAELERLALKEMRILERIDRGQAELVEVRAKIAELKQGRS